jgi:regulator of nucleoside diphosphate kinase
MVLMQSNQSLNPPIFVTESDFEIASSLAERSSSPGAALLRHELARAICLKEGEGPRWFVGLNAIVEYTDLTLQRQRTVKLVEPEAADMGDNRLSVLAPAGAALFGLRTGDTFTWQERGRQRALAVSRLVVAAR